MYEDEIIGLETFTWRSEIEGWVPLRAMFDEAPPPQISGSGLEDSSEALMILPHQGGDSNGAASGNFELGVAVEEEEVENRGGASRPVEEGSHQLIVPTTEVAVAPIASPPGITSESQSRWEERRDGITEKTGKTAATIEICGGIFQIFGLGHFYAGRTAMGVAIMLGYWVIVAINIALLLSMFFLLLAVFFWPLSWIAMMIFSPLRAAAQIQEDKRQVRIQRAGYFW